MREVRDFIVRMFGGQENNLPDGCGFLVGTDRRHILTCCHVVNTVLNRREITKPSETVFVDFPFLAPKTLHKAEVERWHYEINDTLRDICVLKLLDEIPVTAKSAPFVQADDYSGDVFRAFGFPNSFEDNGREVKGVLGATQVNGRVLAEGVSQFGYFIERGFSGTPIWNSNRGGVCGMAFQVDDSSTVKVASFIPTEMLIRATSNLLEISSVIPNYLHRLITDLESRRGVLHYVDLAGQTEVSNDHQNFMPDIDDEFGFSELVQKSHTAQKETTPLGKIRDVLDKHSHFVLIGEAGSSKTTTIRRLALEVARKRVVDNSTPLPLLLYLPRWESGLTAEEFIHSQWVASGLADYGDPIQLLKSGDVLLYLDGLNEMGGQSAANIEKLRHWLRSSNAPQYAIITCRKDNYISDFELGIPVVRIERMSHEHIQQFVRSYTPDKAEVLLERILPSDRWNKENKRHLYHLVRNPYMLVALIIVFGESPNKELPLNNGQLFQMLVRALGKREAQRFSRGWLPFEERFFAVESALANLAFAMIDEEKGTEVNIEYAVKYANREILIAAHDANYVEITGHNVRFYHQLIQEYFCALKLHKDFSKTFLVHTSKLYGVFPNSRWDNTTIMLLGLFPNQNKILNALLENNPLLVSQAFESGVVMEPTYIELVCLKLLSITAQQWGYALNDFNHYDETYTTYEMYPFDNFDSIAGTIEDAISRFGRAATSPLIGFLAHSDPEVCQVVIRTLKRTKDPQAITHLAKRLSDDRRTMWNERLGDEVLAALSEFGSVEALAVIKQWKEENTGN